MKTKPNANVPGRNKPVKAITKVLGQTKIVKVLVNKAAQDLSSVNSALKQGLEGRNPAPGIEKALKKSEAIEGKVEDAADKLAIAEKIIASIQTPCSVGVGDLAIHHSISASMGISIFPKDGATADVLIQSADKAMYRAKASKCRYSFAQ